MILGALLCGFLTGGLFVIALMTWLGSKPENEMDIL